MYLPMAKPLKISQLGRDKTLFTSKYNFIKEKKEHTIPRVLLYSVSPEKQHNMPALYHNDTMYSLAKQISKLSSNTD